MLEKPVPFVRVVFIEAFGYVTIANGWSLDKKTDQVPVVAKTGSEQSIRLEECDEIDEFGVTC